MIALSEANIPLSSEKTQSNENAWYLLETYRAFIPIPLDINEYLAAYILKSNLKIFQHTPLESEVNSLLKKIDQIVPEDVFLETHADGAERVFENYTAGLFDYAPFGVVINNLIDAIRQRKICQITYYNPYEQQEKSFPVEPVRMVYYNGGLYVIVYVRKYENYILLAVQRIRELKVTEERYPRDQSFDPDEFWKGKFGVFSAEEQVEVRLRFSKEVIHHIEGRLWHISQTSTPDDQGNLILTMKVGITPELVTWILGWRMFVEVLEPPALITEIKDNIRAMDKIYRTT